MDDKWVTRFTDDKGNPISHEAFETAGFTKALSLPGQCLVQLRLNKGVLICAARCETEEDFVNFGKVIYQQYVKSNAPHVQK